MRRGGFAESNTAIAVPLSMIPAATSEILQLMESVEESDKGNEN